LTSDRKDGEEKFISENQSLARLKQRKGAQNVGTELVRERERMKGIKRELGGGRIL